MVTPSMVLIMMMLICNDCVGVGVCGDGEDDANVDGVVDDDDWC